MRKWCGLLAVVVVIVVAVEEEEEGVDLVIEEEDAEGLAVEEGAVVLAVIAILTKDLRILLSVTIIFKFDRFLLLMKKLQNKQKLASSLRLAKAKWS